MDKYSVRFSKEHGGKYYQTIVDANTEQDAFIKAKKEAEDKGIILPDEVWTRISKVRNSFKNSTT